MTHCARKRITQSISNIITWLKLCAVSELRDHLKSRGADVAWHDPLVSVWEGSNPVDLGWECDVAILAIKQPGMDVAQLIGRGVQILDCTNSLRDLAGVTSL